MCDNIEEIFIKNLSCFKENDGSTSTATNRLKQVPLMRLIWWKVFTRFGVSSEDLQTNICKHNRAAGYLVNIHNAMGSSVFALSISVDRFERAPKPFSQSHLIDNAMRIDYTVDAIWVHCSYVDRQRDNRVSRW